VYDEQPSGERADMVNGALNVALSLAMTKSNKAIVVKAIPTHGPLMRPIKGFLKFINVLIKLLYIC
jgi:hypothetical protein